MKTNKTVVEQYKKYLQNIKLEQTDVVGSFGKLVNFLDQQCGNNKLSMVIELDAIHKTLKQIRNRGIKLRDQGEWSKITVNRCYDLIKLMNTNFREGNKQAFTLNFYKFWELASKQPTNLRLFMHLVHENNKYNRNEEDPSAKENLYKSEKEKVNKLFQASTEEEIESILEE